MLRRTGVGDWVQTLGLGLQKQLCRLARGHRGGLRKEGSFCSYGPRTRARKEGAM